MNENVNPPIITTKITGSITFLDLTKSNFLNGICISLLGIIFFLDNPINIVGCSSNR